MNTAQLFGLAGVDASLQGLAALPLMPWPLPVSAIGAGWLLICVSAPFVEAGENKH